MSATKKVATVKKVAAEKVVKPVEVKEEVKAPVVAEVKTEVKAEEKAPAKKAVAKKEAVKEAKAPAAKKETAKKAVAAKKTTTKKAAKAAEVKVAIQFADKNYTAEDLAKIANDVWVYDYGKDVADLKDVQLYVKPEESKVYYVFNNEIAGDFMI